DVKSWYTAFAAKNKSVVSLHSVGKSVLGRDLPVLDIMDGDPKNKDIVVFLTRQHPPEVTGYFAFKSFMESLVDASDLSREFLKKYHVLAFPIMNPDGVDLGHWRHNARGVDTNRDWSVYRQPEIRQAVQYINRALKRNNAKLVLGMDFHSTWYDVFYTNQKREETTLPNFIDEWFYALENNIEGYKVNEKSANSTKPVSKGWFLYGHNAVGITYEIGDKTPNPSIEVTGTVSAREMMKILLNNID
ncbi:MAG: M14 family metallopeptidase, partial [Flavobacteriaceae bacterium]